MKNLIVLPILCCVSVAYGATQIKGADPAQAIMVKPNQQSFSIILQANATTGFRWFLRNYNRHYFRFISDTYIAPNTKLIGAPGLAKFTFDVERAFHRGPFISPIHFSYAQPWNLSSKQHATYYVISIPGKPAKLEHIITSHGHSTHAKALLAHPPKATTKAQSVKHQRYHLETGKPVAPVAKPSKTENTSWLSLPTK